MVSAILACALIAAAPPVQAPEKRELKLGAPGFDAVDIDPKKAEFLNNFFAEQLSMRTDKRVRIVTQSEVAALIGLERQKQLLGCSEDSAECLAEITGALGVEGLIVGNVAKFGDTYAITVRVLPAGGGQPMASASGTGMREEQLLDWIRNTSVDFARKLDPGAPKQDGASGAQAQTPVAADEALPRNGIWLSGLGVEYNRRLRGSSWVGVRATAFAVAMPLDFNAHLLAMARHHPIRPGEAWNYSIYAGIGLGGSWLDPDLDRSPLTIAVGAEGGYKALRLSVEALWTREEVHIVPGISVALTF